MRAGALKRLGYILVLTAITQYLTQAADAQTTKDDAQGQIVGTWRGHSTCMVKDSPCHDEVNVYRFSKIADKPDMVTVTASKIVDGKEIVMGTSEWKYDPQKHILGSSDGIFRFTVDGEKMEGALTKDGAVYRRIYLKKEKQSAPRAINPFYGELYLSFSHQR